MNAIEWLGARLKLGTIAIGTILAAIGTALPESVVTLVAVAFGEGEARKDIGVGAAMGGPLVLATIAYGIAGFMMLRHVRARRTAIPLDTTALLNPEDIKRLHRDQLWFLSIFLFKVALGLVLFSWKPFLGAVFFIAYGVYFYKEVNADGEVASDDNLEPLKLQPRRARPQTWAVVLQTVAMLVVIFLASQQFVHQLEWVGPELGLSATVVALLLSPVATELPEILNAIIWIRQGKHQLALANISGAMMIQATVPSGIGIIFTSWHFDAPLVLSGIVTILSIVYLLGCAHLRRLHPSTLVGALALYGVFAVGLLTLT